MYQIMRKIDLIVIHCSATRETVNYKPAQMEEDHKKRGFLCCGYHYYIRRNGDIITMRPIAMPGAHAKGYNAHSIGICYEGGLDAHGIVKDTRTEWQRHSLEVLVRVLLLDYPGSRVVGHRDLSPDLNHNGVVEPMEWTKQCPCFDVSRWMKQVHIL